MLTVVTIDGVSKTRQEHLTGKLPGWIDHLKVAGMAGVIKTHTPTTSKVSARDKQTPGATVLVKGLSMPTEEGSVVTESDSDESNSDSDESSSSVGKKRKSNSKSDENSDESESVDSYDSNESYRSNNFDYTQSDGSQLNRYQNRNQNRNQNKEPEHEIQFQTDSEEEATVHGTTRSGTQYTLAGDETGEIFLVGATGHNYGNTAELNVMTYKEAMASVDKEQWDVAVKEEHDKMKKYNVFRVVNRKDLPPGTKLFDSTWAMKKKPDGSYRARNAEMQQ